MAKPNNYLDRLKNTYEFLNRKYEKELNELRNKIFLEEYYQENKSKLLDAIDKGLLADISVDNGLYSQLEIRGGNYKNVSEHCNFKNALYVVHFSYLFGDNKYVLYLYDNNEPLVYVNNKKTDLDASVQFKPIQKLLILLKANAENYRELNKSDPVFRWGSPEEHGLI